MKKNRPVGGLYVPNVNSLQSQEEEDDSSSPLFGFPEINKNDLEPIAEFGRGDSGGIVWKVNHKTFHRIMAQKKEFLTQTIQVNLRPNVRKQILKDLQLLKICNNPYIVEFYGAFCSESEISICTEFMDGLSFDVIMKKTGRIPEPILGKVSVAVLNAMNYLKSEFQLFHRNIKPSNILVNTKGEIKLCDLSVSGQLSNIKANAFVSNKTYIAPERCVSSCYDIKSDIWSFGLSLVELALGRYPYPIPTDSELPKSVAQEPLISTFELLKLIVDGPPPRLHMGMFSADFADMIEVCLNKDPRSRADVKTLLVTFYIQQKKHSFTEKNLHSNIDVSTWIIKRTMADELSGITIVYLIAIGLQVFILLFLFGKRQIMRFTWGAKKTPNTPLGYGFPKQFKKEVTDSLTIVGGMRWEPKLEDE